jgi:hypothetical protein
MIASSPLTSSVAVETVQAENDRLGDRPNHNKNIPASIDKPSLSGGLLESILVRLKMILAALIA